MAEFDTALDSWLNGDDAAALQHMSALAQAGDEKARLFLGQIEQQTYLHATVTSGMDRKTRIALLRAPKKPFGKSWLTLIDNPHARTLLKTRSGADVDDATFRALLETGEIPLLIRALATRINYGGALPDWITHPDYLPYTLPLLNLHRPYLESGMAPGGAGTLTLKGLDAAHKAGGDSAALVAPFSNDPSKNPVGGVLNAPAETLAQAAQTRGIFRACVALCPNARAPCTRSLAAALARNSILAFEPTFSPVPTLVSTERYRASPRYTQDILQKLKASDNATAIARENACLAQQF